MKYILSLILVSLLIAACAPNEAQTQQADASIVVDAAATDTPLPTITLPPVTSTPTLTRPATATYPPKPTNTPPEDTPTPDPRPTPTPSRKPVVFTGSGDKIIDIPEGFTEAFVDLEHQDKTDFIVTKLNGNSQNVGLMVEAYSAYSGRRSLGFFDYGIPRRLHVQTQGAWTITLYPAEFAYSHRCQAPGTCSGKGDDVIVFSAPPGRSRIHHYGGTFILMARADDPQVLINDLNPRTDEIVFPAGTRLVQITAEREWMMDLSTKR